MPRTILMVDDDAALLGAVRRVLERAGYEVMGASNVGEARAAISARALDLVIMDLVLPGMEGRETANLIRARQPDLPVLFVSGYTSQESMRLGHLNPGDIFLRKPFEIGELLSVVDGMLRAAERE